MTLKVISLFTGVGGLDFGFEAAGFETVAALDLDPVACRMLRLNRPWPVLDGDVAKISSEDILNTAGLRYGDADVLIGGPPCQPFSKSGYWANGDARRLDDPRSGTLGQFLRVMRDTLPRAFLLENVPGLAYAGKNEGLELIRNGIEAINAQTGTRYSVCVKMLNAADYGVPQLRERVVVVGARDGKQFEFPVARFGSREKCLSDPELVPYRTTWDALGDLPSDPNDPCLRMTGKWADLLPTIPEGRNYLWHTSRGGGYPLFGWRRRYWSFLLKLAKDQPSWTIQAQPGPATGPFHWRNRKLSPDELARLQTFPSGLRYDCPLGDVQRLIGNAVPSALGEILAREIRQQLLDDFSFGAQPILIPSARTDTPVPECTASLPKKFMHLVGDHDAHPGTGRGRRASGRLKEAA